MDVFFRTLPVSLVILIIHWVRTRATILCGLYRSFVDWKDSAMILRRSADGTHHIHSTLQTGLRGSRAACSWIEALEFTRASVVADSPTFLCVLCLWVPYDVWPTTVWSEIVLNIYCPIFQNCSLRQTVLVQEAQCTGFHVLLTERCHCIIFYYQDKSLHMYEVLQVQPRSTLLCPYARWGNDEGYTSHLKRGGRSCLRCFSEPWGKICILVATTFRRTQILLTARISQFQRVAWMPFFSQSGPFPSRLLLLLPTSTLLCLKARTLKQETWSLFPALRWRQRARWRRRDWLWQSLKMCRSCVQSCMLTQNIRRTFIRCSITWSPLAKATPWSAPVL